MRPPASSASSAARPTEGLFRARLRPPRPQRPRRSRYVAMQLLQVRKTSRWIPARLGRSVRAADDGYRGPSIPRRSKFALSPGDFAQAPVRGCRVCVGLTLHRQPIHSRRCVEYSGKLHHLSGVALLARASIYAKVPSIYGIYATAVGPHSVTRAPVSRALAVSLGGSQAHNSPDRTNDRTRTRANFTVSRVRRRGGANLGVP